MLKTAWTMLGIALLTSAVATAQTNPCNPCNPGGGKTAMVAVNPCFAMAGTVFYVNDPAHRNWVKFKSSAPLEDILGTTTEVTGYLVFDPENPKKGGKGELTLPVSSLDTGIPLRNTHLQSKDWLDAETHSQIKLTITDVKNIKKVKSGRDYKTYNVKLVGTFEIKGRSHSVQFPGRLTYLKETKQTRQKMAGNLLAARAIFNLDLADYGISGPPGAGLIGSKVGKSVEVEVSLIASSQAPGMATNPCNPCTPHSGKAENPCNPCSM